VLLGRMTSLSPEGERAEPLLALVHVPKTAGSTLTALMRYHYRGGRFLTSGNVFSRFEQVEAKLHEIQRKTHIAAVAGHFTVGLVDQALSGSRCMTILRDPVERTLSHYYFLVQPRAGRRRAAGPAIVPPWLPAPPPGLTLAEATAERSYIPDNLQTRMLCGIVSPYDPLPSDALEQAKRNVRERFAFVGTTERFSEFLALLNLELCWPTLAYKSYRVHAARPRGTSLAAGDVRVVEKRNALDLDLYAYAGELLEQVLARRRSDVDEEVEVLRRALHRWNAERGSASPARPPLPLDARVELALKEAELARVERRLKRLIVARKREARQPPPAR
jgi:hypothetical protein